MKIELLYFGGCPNHEAARRMVQEALETLGRHDRIHEVEVRTKSEAEATGFVGSPSIRINGSDIEPWARTANGFGISCRAYIDGAHRDGLPSRDLIRRAIMEGIREGS